MYVTYGHRIGDECVGGHAYITMQKAWQVLYFEASMYRPKEHLRPMGCLRGFPVRNWMGMAHVINENCIFFTTTLRVVTYLT